MLGKKEKRASQQALGLEVGGHAKGLPTPDRQEPVPEGIWEGWGHCPPPDSPFEGLPHLQKHQVLRLSLPL